jgi:hypothetical protein
LPDGVVSYQFDYILEGLGMENVGIFSGQKENYMTISYAILPFCNFAVVWYIFTPFWYIVTRKSGNPFQNS